MEIHFKQFGLFLFAIIMLILLVGCGTQATISFDTNGGSPIDDITFTVGEGVDMPDNPTKEGYQFEDWYIDKDLTNLLVDIQNIEEDITLYAKWSELEYTVTFYSGEDQEDAVTTKYGEEAIAPIPETKEGYTFTGWDNDFSNVTSDMDVNAEYSKNSFSVTFRYGDDQEEVVTTKYGEGAIAPTNTEKDKYIFEKWDTDFSKITSDLVVNAIYNIDITQTEYTVSFHYADDQTTEVTVKYGLSAQAPIGDELNKTGYNFTGWDSDFSNVTNDLNVNAVYSKKTYSITFIYNDQVLSSTVEYESAAVAPIDTSKTGYNFVGWDTDFSNVTENLIVKAEYEIKTFDVTFNYNGKTSVVEDIEYGQSAIAPTDTEKTGYNFVEWDHSFNSVTKDLNVNAVYAKKTYVVTFNYNEKVYNDTVEYETAATAPTDTSKTGYNFIEWDTDFSSVTSNLTVKAVYEIKTCNVTFIYGENNLTKTVVSVNYGDSAVAPEDTEKTGYNFVKWDIDFSNVTNDLNVNASYSKKTYSVAFIYNDQVLSSTVEYESAAVAPTDTSKTGYNFVG